MRFKTRIGWETKAKYQRMGGSREERKECSPLRKLLKELRKKKGQEEEIKARKRYRTRKREKELKLRDA